MKIQQLKNQGLESSQLQILKHRIRKEKVEYNPNNYKYKRIINKINNNNNR